MRIILDQLTNRLSKMTFMTTDEYLRIYPTSSIDGESHLVAAYFDPIVERLRDAGTFDQAKIVQAILQKGSVMEDDGWGNMKEVIVTNPDQISGKMLADWLITTTRDRWQVKPYELSYSS